MSTAPRLASVSYPALLKEIPHKLNEMPVDFPGIAVILRNFFIIGILVLRNYLTGMPVICDYIKSVE